MPRLIDDFSTYSGAAITPWVMFTDRVMGGVSQGRAEVALVNGRRALRLRGTVSLERNGGFIQVARPLGARAGEALDARAYAGMVVQVCGVPGSYFLHLRTADTTAPWQYYAAQLQVTNDWADVQVPWESFRPASLRARLDVSRLVRLGVVAATAAFEADLAVALVALVP